MEVPNQAAATEDFEFDALREAKNYRAGLVKEFSPWLKGRVLEVGAGIGQMTRCLREAPGIELLQSVEPHAPFCRQIRRELPGQPLVEGVISDLPADSHWDAIVSINVLEHIQDDEGELRRFHDRLAARHGALCLFVPARPELYAPIDKDFGHHRRYARPELARKLRQAGFEIERLRYFNLAAYFAWLLLFRGLGKRKFNTASVRFFDRVIFPPVHALEWRVAAPPIGQSLLAVGRAV